MRKRCKCFLDRLRIGMFRAKDGAGCDQSGGKLDACESLLSIGGKGKAQAVACGDGERRIFPEAGALEIQSLTVMGDRAGGIPQPERSDSDGVACLQDDEVVRAELAGCLFQQGATQRGRLGVAPAFVQQFQQIEGVNEPRFGLARRALGLVQGVDWKTLKAEDFAQAIEILKGALV